MNIEFQSKGLEDLYFFGSTEEKTYNKLSKDIIKRYQSGKLLESS